MEGERERREGGSGRFKGHRKRGMEDGWRTEAHVANLPLLASPSMNI